MLPLSHPKFICLDSIETADMIIARMFGAINAQIGVEDFDLTDDEEGTDDQCNVFQSLTKQIKRPKQLRISLYRLKKDDIRKMIDASNENSEVKSYILYSNRNKKANASQQKRVVGTSYHTNHHRTPIATALKIRKYREYLPAISFRYKKL